MCENADKIKVGLQISKELYKKFNQKILEIHGNIYGHIRSSVEDALRLWLKVQESGGN